jgi:hypothetical protein
MAPPKKKPLAIPGAAPALEIPGAEPEPVDDELEPVVPPPAEPRAAVAPAAPTGAGARALQMLALANSGPEEPPPDVSKLQSFGRGAQNALSLGWDDEGAGMVDAGMDAAQSAVHRMFPGIAPEVMQRTLGRGFVGEGEESKLDPRSGYELGRDRAREEHDKAKTANPGTYFAGQVAGGVAQSAPGFAIAPGATMLARAAQAMPINAALGALYGAGESAPDGPGGNTDDVPLDALEGGVVSAVAGPVLGETAHQALKVPGAVANFVRRQMGTTPPARVTPIRPEIRAQYDGAGPQIQAADDLTRPDAVDLRQLARAGADDEAIGKHAEGLRTRFDELAREATPLGPSADDPKAQELAAAALRTDLEHLWPERELALRGADPQVIEKHAREIQQKVSDIWKATDSVKWTEDITSKGPLVSKLLQRDRIDPGSVITEAQRVAGNVTDAIEGLKAGGYAEQGTPDGNLLVKLGKEAKEFQAGSPTDMRWGFGSPYDEAGKYFLRLDQLKREFQRHLVNARERRDSLIVNELEGIEEMLRNHLEDPKKWGRGTAALQEVRNRAWRDRLLLKSKNADPNRLFLSDASGQPSADPYRPLLEGDPAGLVRILKNAGEFTGSNETAALRRWAQREAQLADALSDHIDPDPELRKAASIAKQRAKEIGEILDTRMKEASAARGLEQPGPKLARDPAKLVSLVRSVKDFGSAEDVAALRAWVEEQSDQPFNDAPTRNAIRNVLALLDRAPPEPAPDNLGLKLAQNPEAIMELVRSGKSSPELDQWLQNQAGNTPRSRTLVDEISGIRGTRAQQARAAQLLGQIGKPTPTPSGPMRSVAESLPWVGRVARKANEPVDLQAEVAQLAQLERVLKLDPNNEAAKTALARIFANVRGQRVATTPRGGIPASLLTAQPSGHAVTE